ncbi:methyltransferase domain-containing protein [Colletotrichum orchidophilum]|uniref:Methyltransferase domain-containing protein n=1 Tax=Colletotrichum orchidophilum TaxID=1209926 RepID=A0A1G4B2H3_9PEZI|nr:methyltransferase domain-containing protein [Colletotrichum orchidophilum]OHE95619.1 methyltransferase domain-containing protein [Colletotrichum orchidophilum]
MTSSPSDRTPAPTASSPTREKTASPKATSPSRSKTASPIAQSSPAGEDLEDDIEVDEGLSVSDGASLMDDQISSYTASLASSAVDYPIEHGRRYHAFRAGAYYAPNDESEMERLDFLSTLIFKVIGKSYLAPIEQDKTHRILDIGTGTGIWAIEMGDLFPNAEIIGNDLSANQPTWVPSNVKFEVDDVESPWLHSTKFDYIFCRLMAGAIGDWPRLVKNIYDNTSPGGWVEFQDLDLLYRSDDGSITDEHDCMKMNKTFISTCKQIGREPCPGPLFKDWVTEAGFINVSHQRYKLPLGPWPKDPHLKDVGLCNLICVLDGLEAFNLRLLTGVLGWTKEEVMVMLAACRNELKTGAFHARMEL